MNTKYMAGSFKLMKSLNRSLILNTIREHGQISRAEIAKLTKLTPPTVGNIVKELLEAEIVIEQSQGVSKGGRKPTMLVINARSFFMIGVDAGPASVHVIMTDLNADIVQMHEVPLKPGITEADFLNLMISGIKEVINSGKASTDQIIGIGVAMHGIVDIENGISLFAPNLQLRDIPIKETLEKEFAMIVKVENDARAMALGETWFGNGKDVDHLVCVNVASGVGAGVVINGKLFHGEHDLAGEIGHMCIDLNGPRCTCGNYGCLQTHVSGPAIADRAARDLSLGKESILRDMAGNLNELTGEMLHEAAQKGDRFSIEQFELTGRYLGIGLINLIHLLNPKRIIIGGGVSLAGDYLLESARQTVKTRALTESAKNTEIVLSKLGKNAAAIGAVSLILVELFSTKANQS
ncbi:ROK family transcriptional regulator [Fictibacillus aquaticus]|uniref:Sugar kinase n=1 Tax=Fictibacillus aquaticus TaxID=2021314 RepID=A0A235F8B2_9BACL|nr:ROK family transcriptional regulator [Fictibacillus aquaticus]OYD57482.1 sugar kinase [Fictibacillus aquaticus]